MTDGRVGVLGGTFDPLHFGHLRAAEAVADALELDKIWFVPAASPPHKSMPGVTEARHRVAMVERGIEAEPRFELSRVEIEREGPSYTIDTLRELRSASPGAALVFITGVDAFIEIGTWKDWRALLDEFSFAVHERPGFELERAREVAPAGARVVEESDATALERGLKESVVLLVRRPMLHVSSTEIRDLVEKGRSIRFLVPEAVEDYIESNRLYERKLESL